MTRNYEAIHKLENNIREGKKHIYLFNKPIEVSVWYGCFFGYNWNNEMQRDEVYFDLEGRTVNGKYFNIKSTDAIAEKIIIK